MYVSTWATATYSFGETSSPISLVKYNARASSGCSKTGTLLASATRRMFSAIRSVPFATTRGAFIFAAS